jgi:hypothetical protein
MLAQQGTLFDTGAVLASTPDAAREHSLIEWSYSRRELFERCLLWYYFQYYGSKSGTAKGEPRKQELRFLKTLSNRHLRTGQIMHLVIRTYLRHLKEGDRWTLDKVLTWARDIYRGDLRRSLRHQQGLTAVDPGDRSVILSEFHLGVPQAKPLWEESEARLVAALTNFVTRPELERFRRGATHPDSLIEENLRLREEHFSLKGQIDLAYPEARRVVILDWKLGASGGGEDSLQLLSYALVATKHYGCPPESLDLFKVHLEDVAVTSYPVREEEVRRARVRIIQDSQQMLAVDHYGRNGVASAFTPCGQSRICSMCPFQQFCAKGVEAA